MNSDNFPYRNNIYTDTDRIDKFNNLKKYNLKLEISKIKPYVNIKLIETVFLYKSQFYYLTYNSNDYKNIQILSDLFNDDCRVLCKFGNNMAPYDYYQQNKDKLINYLKNKKQEINNYNLREAIYENLPMECSIHHPALIKQFIKMCKAKKILDVSAGWGDRLLGAIASNIDLYVATDPNPCVHKGYKKMVELLLPYSINPKCMIDIIESPFETANLDKYNDYDLVYTSPPYFDYEKYSNKSGQSHLSFTTEDSWYKNFLQVSINKCIDKLRNGGYLILYISQEKGKTYMEKLLTWLPEQLNIYYLGCMFYSNEKIKGPNPIFIYKKLLDRIPRRLYNPKVIIEKINIDNKMYNVVRDDYIIGGTKMRAGLLLLQNILKNKEIKNIIYGGATNGYAQICIAYSLYLLKRKDIELILPIQQVNNKEIHKIQTITKYYHNKTKYIIVNDTMKGVWKIIDSYDKKCDYVLPFGFGSEEYEKILIKQLKRHIKDLLNIKRLWLVVGSGTILKVLQQILPETLFFGVQVGKTLKDEDIYDKSRLVLYISSQKLYNEYDKKSDYYMTVSSYDAKVLEFVKLHGIEGDYIWNVAGIHQKIF